MTEADALSGVNLCLQQEFRRISCGRMMMEGRGATVMARGGCFDWTREEAAEFANRKGEGACIKPPDLSSRSASPQRRNVPQRY